MRMGIILLVASLMAGLTSCVKLKNDKRVADFEKYILEQVDRNAYDECTEENMINMITSRYNHGKEFDDWLDDIRKDREDEIEKLYDYCKVIHKLDREAGRELSFEEAMKIVREHYNRSVMVDDIVGFQAHIDGIIYYTQEIVLWDETCKWEKKMKKEGKEIKLNQDLL